MKMAYDLDIISLCAWYEWDVTQIFITILATLLQQSIRPSSTTISSGLQQGKGELHICCVQCCAFNADQILVILQSATFTVAAHMMYSGLVMELDCLS